MASSNTAVIKELNRLYRICIAGEKGFAVVAANIGNRGLKITLKTFAQQRAQFAAELKNIIQKLGGSVAGEESIPGIIHRGRINILATLTIGMQNVENIALGEAIIGEKAAINAYRKALAKPMPVEIRTTLERHFEKVQETHDQVDLLRGKTGQRLVVLLFDSESDTAIALQGLVDAGFPADRVETMDVSEVTDIHIGKDRRVSESVISGAVGGAIWGSVIGAVAGLSALTIPGMEPFMGISAQNTWALVSLSGTVIGALVAAFLGLVIGLGVSEEDAIVYKDSLKYGVKLVRLYTENGRFADAHHILRQIAALPRLEPNETITPNLGIPPVSNGS